MANGTFKKILLDELAALERRRLETLEKRDAIIKAHVDGDKLARQLTATTMTLVKIQQAKATINEVLTAYKKWKKEEP